MVSPGGLVECTVNPVLSECGMTCVLCVNQCLHNLWELKPGDMYNKHAEQRHRLYDGLLFLHPSYYAFIISFTMIYCDKCSYVAALNYILAPELRLHCAADHNSGGSSFFSSSKLRKNLSFIHNLQYLKKIKIKNTVRLGQTWQRKGCVYCGIRFCLISLRGCKNQKDCNAEKHWHRTPV